MCRNMHSNHKPTAPTNALQIYKVVRHRNLRALVKIRVGFSAQRFERLPYRAGGGCAWCVYILDNLAFCSILYICTILSLCVIAFSHPSPLGLKDLRRSLSNPFQLTAETCVNTTWSPFCCRARSNTLSIKRNIRIASFNACNWVHADKVSIPNSVDRDGDLITRAPRLPGLEWEIKVSVCVLALTANCIFYRRRTEWSWWPITTRMTTLKPPILTRPITNLLQIRWANHSSLCFCVLLLSLTNILWSPEHLIVNYQT